MKYILALSTSSKGPFPQTLFLSSSDIYMSVDADCYLVVVSSLPPFSDASSSILALCSLVNKCAHMNPEPLCRRNYDPEMQNVKE